MSGRRQSGSGRRSQPHKRSKDASDTHSKSKTSPDKTPRMAVDGTPKKTHEFQTPARSVRSGKRSTIRLLNVPGRTPARPERVTPYRTPRLTTLPHSQAPPTASVKKADAKLWKGHLNKLLNRSMKICYLSSVANFTYKEEKFRRRYEKTLENKIMEVYPSPRTEVKLTVSSCLNWKPSVVDAVWLEVRSLVAGDTPEEDIMVLVYDAWLIRTTRAQSSSLETVDWMPVMIYSGRELIHQTVLNWLQGSFHCYVTRSGLPQSDFLWISGVRSGYKCLDSSHNKDDALVEFTYMILPPLGMSNFTYPNDRSKPKIVVKLLMKEVHLMWNRVIGSNSSGVSIEDLQRYLSAITSVTSTITSLPASVLRLQEFRTPCVNINSNGKLRLLCQRSSTSVIQSFMDVFLQRTTAYMAEDLQDAEEMDTIEELNNNKE